MTRLTDSQKIEIVNKYLTNKYTCNELGIEYGVCRSAVSKLLNRRNIQLNHNLSTYARKYTLNELFFQEIDNEAKAYFLGLLYADGYNDSKRSRVVLSLLDIDKEIIEIFKKEIQYDGPISFSNRKKKNPIWNNAYSISVCSNRLCKDLINLGCFNKKTLILNFPTNEQVPNHLLRHFIRGYFDGDGCVGLYAKRKSSSISIVSTLNFCLRLKEIIINNLDIKPLISSPKHCLLRNNNITKNLNFGGNVQVKNFLDWIYKDSTVFLKRKYLKYKELCNWFDTGFCGNKSKYKTI